MECRVVEMTIVMETFTQKNLDLLKRKEGTIMFSGLIVKMQEEWLSCTTNEPVFGCSTDRKS